MWGEIGVPLNRLSHLPKRKEMEKKITSLQNLRERRVPIEYPIPTTKGKRHGKGAHTPPQFKGGRLDHSPGWNFPPNGQKERTDRLKTNYLSPSSLTPPLISPSIFRPVSWLEIFQNPSTSKSVPRDFLLVIYSN
jgi:hypothetical protein